jgi:hypothetical protein
MKLFVKFMAIISTFNPCALHTKRIDKIERWGQIMQKALQLGETQEFSSILPPKTWALSRIPEKYFPGC